MSKYDINRPIDFARITSQKLGGELSGAASPALAQLFASFSRDQSEWNIVECSYTPSRYNKSLPPTPVLFNIFVSKRADARNNYQASMPSIRDSGGRRSQSIELLYEDGETQEDLGRKGEHFSLEIIVYGLTYRNGLNKILTVLQQPTSGTLLHPVRGEVECKLDTYEIEHSHDRTNAAMLRITLRETNFSALSFGKLIDTFTTKLAKALAILNAISAMIQLLGAIGTIARSVARQIIAKINEYTQTFRSFLVDCNSTFGVAGAVSSLPGIVPVSAGGLAAPASSRARASTAVTAGTGGTATLPGGFVQVGTRFRTVVAANDPLASVPKELLSDVARQALAAQDLTKRCSVLRGQVQEILDDFKTNGIVLDMYEGILSLKQSVIAAQEVLEQGLQSSQTRIINYTTPRLMSIREVAFENGISPNSSSDIELLNQWLESVNYIPAGTVLKVPVS